MAILLFMFAMLSHTRMISRTKFRVLSLQIVHLIALLNADTKNFWRKKDGLKKRLSGSESIIDMSQKGNRGG